MANGKGINGKVYGLVGAVIVILLITVLGPEMFSAIYDMNISEVPAWVKTVLTVVVGAGLVLLAWRAISE
jgi:protein-S-isoprenylcysteine O-methyltransferase Ste14